MKKNIAAMVCILMFAGMLAGCGNQEKNKSDEQAEGTEQAAGNGAEDVYLSDFTAGDYVTLGEYKGLEVEISAPEVTDKNIDRFISDVLAENPELEPITDRNIAEAGDVADVDFEGKIDGVAFDGGTAAGYHITLGAGGFIEGFEEGIIGMEVGETKDLNLAFPDPYLNNPDLSGTPVVFTITLNSINAQKAAELTDEYVAGLSIEGCSTVEDFREYVREGLTQQAQAYFERNKEDYEVIAIISKAVENASFKEIPQGMLDRINDTVTEALSSQAQMYGQELADYVAYMYNCTVDTYEDAILEEAQASVRQCLVAGAIGEAEGIRITDEKLEEILAEEASQYGYESVEQYKEAIDVESYRDRLLMKEVVEFLKESAVIKE